MVRLGQNFLVDPNLLDAIVRDAGLSPEDVVLVYFSTHGTLARAVTPKRSSRSSKTSTSRAGSAPMSGRQTWCGR